MPGSRIARCLGAGLLAACIMAPLSLHAQLAGAAQVVHLEIEFPDGSSARAAALEGTTFRISYEGVGVLGFSPKVINAQSQTVLVDVYEVDDLEVGTIIRKLETVRLQGAEFAQLNERDGFKVRIESIAEPSRTTGQVRPLSRLPLTQLRLLLPNCEYT